MRRVLFSLWVALIVCSGPAWGQDEEVEVPDLLEPGADLFFQEEVPIEEPAVTAQINFIYLYSNDLAAARRFYTDLLGLTETSFKDGPEGWLGYQSGSLQFLIFPALGSLPATAGWADQPGWDGGDVKRVSWSVEVAADRFRPLVQSLVDSGAECFSPAPLWCQDSYWSFPVRDPMGNTVEVYCTPPVRPKNTDWRWD